MNTLVLISFWNRLNEDVVLRFDLLGVGMNLRPRPMMVVRDFGMGVSLVVWSCIAMLEGRVK